MNKYLILLLGSTSTFLLDQYSKWQILRNFDLRESVALIPGFFSITYVRNLGAAFGIFYGYGKAFFLVISLFAIAFILYLTWKTQKDQKLIALALAFIFGGALGNLFDRAFHGFVVDFIEITIGGKYQWPTFNVADVAICVGVGLLLFELPSQREEERGENPGRAGASA